MYVYYFLELLRSLVHIRLEGPIFTIVRNIDDMMHEPHENILKEDNILLIIRNIHEQKCAAKSVRI